MEAPSVADTNLVAGVCPRCSSARFVTLTTTHSDGVRQMRPLERISGRPNRVCRHLAQRLALWRAEARWGRSVKRWIGGAGSVRWEVLRTSAVSAGRRRSGRAEARCGRTVTRRIGRSGSVRRESLSTPRTATCGVARRGSVGEVCDAVDWWGGIGAVGGSAHVGSISGSPPVRARRGSVGEVCDAADWRVGLGAGGREEGECCGVHARFRGGWAGGWRAGRGGRRGIVRWRLECPARQEVPPGGFRR